MHLTFGRPSPCDTPCTSASAENNGLPRTEAQHAQWVCLVPPEWRDLRSPLVRPRSSPTLQCPALPSTTAFSVTVPQLSDALDALHGCRNAMSARDRVLTSRVCGPWRECVQEQAMRDTHELRGSRSLLRYSHQRDPVNSSPSSPTPSSLALSLSSSDPSNSHLWLVRHRCRPTARCAPGRSIPSSSASQMSGTLASPAMSLVPAHPAPFLSPGRIASPLWYTTLSQAPSCAPP